MRGSAPPLGFESSRILGLSTALACCMAAKCGWSMMWRQSLRTDLSLRSDTVGRRDRMLRRRGIEFIVGASHREEDEGEEGVSPEIGEDIEEDLFWFDYTIANLERLLTSSI